MNSNRLNKKIFITLFFGICVFCSGKTTYAATYYMPNDFANLHAAFSGMASGDTLIIRDGTYTGAANVIDQSHRPPNGSGTGDNPYTIIKAEYAGKVIFDGQNSTKMAYLRGNDWDRHMSYIQYEGIEWCKAGGNTIVDILFADHIKLLHCGAYETSGNGSSFFVGESVHILLEDCYAFGGARKIYYIGRNAEKVVLRRCVGRHDYAHTLSGSTDTFMAYDCDEIEFQNCITIDANNLFAHYSGMSECPYSFTTRNSGQGVDDVYFRGCMSVGSTSGGGALGSNGCDTHFIDCVIWDTYRGSRLRGSGYNFDHCTLGAVVSSDSSNSATCYLEYGDPITNSIVYGNGNYYGIQSAVGNDYNCVYNNATNFVGCSPGAHSYCPENSNEINPQSGSLEYLVRIESSSDLDDVGSSGDIGANILKKIGVSGTLWGETGYNTTTNDNLWPFPNEELIREKMRDYSYTDGNGTITGARGFCDDGQTLTKYIWEYLGNPIPPEIYGSHQQNTPPVANAGADPTVTDSDNNGSEEVILDGSASYDPDGSIASYVWSENGQQKATGESPTVILSTGVAHEIQLIVIDNLGATGEDTVQITVNPPAGDNTPPVISDVQAGNVSTQSATITWTTDEPSNSKAEYGVSNNYGLEVTDSSLVTNHTISLSGLLQETAYHFKIISSDSSGNISESGDFTFTTGAQSAQMNTLQDFEDTVLWQPGGSQDPTGNGRGWAFLSAGSGDMLEIDNIGANGTNNSLKLTFASSNDSVYFRSNDKITDHMPEAENANRMSFYVRFPEGFPIQPLPFRYDTWQLGTFIHDPDNWDDTHSATSEDDHGRHHYYSRLTIEQVGDGWVKYIVNTHPDQANYSGSTVPPDIPYYFDNFGRFYFQFGPGAGGPNPGSPFTIWIDEIKFYYDDGSVGGQIHNGGQDDAGFDGQFFADTTGQDNIPPGDVTAFNAVPGNSQVALSWTNPADTDFKGVMIRCGTDDYPANYQEGTLVRNQIGQPGSSDAFVHSDGVQNGTTYYYSAFTYDDNSNYSSTAHASATPQENPGANQAPIVTITSSYTGEANSRVNFTSSVEDPDGQIISCHWDFGDGDGNDNCSATTHTYSKPGSYTVTATSTDDDGATGADSIKVLISPDVTPPKFVSAVAVQ